MPDLRIYPHNLNWKFTFRREGLKDRRDAIHGNNVSPTQLPESTMSLKYIDDLP